MKRSLRRAGAEPIDAEVAVAGAHHLFDEGLNLTDAALRAEVEGLVVALADRAREMAERPLAA